VFEPTPSNGAVRLSNCPFAALAEQDLGPFEFAIRAGVGSMDTMPSIGRLTTSRRLRAL